MDTDKLTSWVDQAQPILVAKLVGAAMTRQQFDPTVQRYLVSFITVTLNIILVVAILGYFGVETTSFAALVAGVGVAIGAAWSGLLGNFAAGIFLLVLRPYQVDDYVMIGGVEGTVMELGVLGTTPDNVKTIVGNGKIMGSDIKNYTANLYRRVELVAQLAGSADVHKAMAMLKDAVSNVPNTGTTPPVDVEILELNGFGPKLAVRPYCHTKDYWQVYFDTNMTIADTLGAAGFPVAAHPVKLYPI